ncbi:hypothetical protein KAR91_85250 [Candidatus Pacearchaeota archaeon]|nr:hypothetical protein [Candidatus Pacearchaeota archaeon]
MDKGKLSYPSLLSTLEKEAGQFSPEMRQLLKLVIDNHAGQFRVTNDKGMKIPYIVHPVGVAINAIRYFDIAVALETDINTIISVALAHDLIEDTHVNPDQLRLLLSESGFALVEGLTKPLLMESQGTSANRNEEQVKKIQQLGQTAIYIKICDSMHNLSKPKITPIRLLKKTVEKARNYYLPLLENSNLGSSFEIAFREAIDKAENYILQSDEIITTYPKIFTLAEALDHCIFESTGKVIEIHDLCDILMRVCSCDEINILQNEVNSNKIFEILNKKAVDDSPQTSQDVYDVVDRDVLYIPKKVIENPSPSVGCQFFVSKIKEGYTIPIQISPHIRYIIALGYSSNNKPSWLTLNAMVVITQFLSHRLIVAQLERREVLAATTADLGMRLNLDQAIILGVRPSELIALEQWRLQSNIALQKLRYFFDLFNLSRQGRKEKPILINFETRVKETESIINKFVRQKNTIQWPFFDQMEDIAGARAICEFLGDIKLIEEAILDKKASAFGIQLHPGFKDNRRDYLSEGLADGYRSLHLIIGIMIETSSGDLQEIPCELQLRTIFQDGWARKYHLVMYGKSRKLRRRYGDKLVKMSQLLDECDMIADEVAANVVKQKEDKK